MNTTLLSTPDQIQQVADQLTNESIIAFDTEFIREKTFYPALEIIQFATLDEVWLIDCQPFRNQSSFEDISPILDVLQNPDILKVVHSAHGDQEALFTNLGVVAKPTLDTSIAAGLCGYGENVGLANLLKSVMNVTIKKGHARTDWSARPLPIQLAKYAREDVRTLVRLGKTLLDQLEEMGRKQWALDESARWEDPSLYEPNPDSIIQKLSRNQRINESNYPIMAELVRWREARIRELNIPRRWLASDDLLINLSCVRPTDIDHLKTFRGLSKRELSKYGEQILEAIERGEQSTEELHISSKRSSPAKPEEAKAIELLRCFIGVLALKHNIALTFLINSNHYLPLLRRHPQTVDELIERELLSPNAAKLVGQDIIDFLHGRRSLAIENSSIEIIEIKS